MSETKAHNNDVEVSAPPSDGRADSSTGSWAYAFITKIWFPLEMLSVIALQ